ncbi:MAG: DEAD/DEAH box helicase, partial [Candidatus Altiarchaeota archaeon]|nr:DEAD/DEAH box helicase [Candidatus Altiarchaeota archaeon]
MLFEDLDVGEEFKVLLEDIGMSELYPPQQLAVEAGILDGGNLILCTPTASGKTLAAELAIMKVLEKGGKAVYVVPLRALAYEKYGEFKKYEKLGYRVRLEVGDLDSSKYGKHGDFDILVSTAEKCDSILRSRPTWFNGTKILVLDEIHLIASDRGPVYEVLTAKYTRIYPDVQVLGLSATIGNAQELANWLRAELVTSEWRPVKLKEDVVVKTDDGLTETVKNALAGGQALVFVNSRKSAEAVAEKLSKELGLKVENWDLAEEILSALTPPTKQCRRLSACVLGGTAFHHAGLVNSQRTAVENAFKKGDVKLIVATPTLAAGVNLPSRTVVLRDVKRYSGGGLTYIDVLEYKQMVGRAGRPKYDKIGYSVTLAKNEDELDFIHEHYILGQPEDITSRLGVQPVLRFHILALVSSGYAKTQEALSDFIASTFYGHQYGVGGELRRQLKEIVDELVDWGFIEENERFLQATQVGGRVSELYIDPLTAHNFLTLFELAQRKNIFSEIGLLEVLCDAAEMPTLNATPREESVLWSEAYEMDGQLLRELDGFGLDYMFLNRFKTAKMFMEWITERTEDEILEDFGTAPGQLNSMMQNLQWLCYAAAEL